METLFVKNPFRQVNTKAAFDAVVREYARRSRELFHPGGHRNVGHPTGSAFWRGYDGAAWPDKVTPLWVAYRAGEAVRAAEKNASEATAWYRAAVTRKDTNR